MTVHSVLLWGHSKHLVTSITSPAGDKPLKALSLLWLNPHVHLVTAKAKTPSRAWKYSQLCWHSVARRHTESFGHDHTYSRHMQSTTSSLVLCTLQRQLLLTVKLKNYNRESPLSLKDPSRSQMPTSLAQQPLAGDWTRFLCTLAVWVVLTCTLRDRQRGNERTEAAKKFIVLRISLAKSLQVRWKSLVDKEISPLDYLEKRGGNYWAEVKHRVSCSLLLLSVSTFVLLSPP